MNESERGAPWQRRPLGLRTVDVDGLPFVASQVDELAALITTCAVRGEGGWVVTPNVDILRRWRRDATFRTLVADATLFTPDGAPIVWASRLAGDPLPGRLAGSDLFVSLFVAAARAGLRIALIGGNPGSAETASAVLIRSHRLPEDCVRTHCPPIGFEHSIEEMAAVESLIDEWKPAVIFVGLGSPKQEGLIARLRRDTPAAWFLGVGVSFSFVAGDVSRAPRWVQRCGLEWLHRLIQEPGRLARRYLLDGVPFALQLMLRSAVKTRI